MRTWFTLTARSKRYGPIPLGRYDTLKKVRGHIATLIPGTEVLIVEHTFDGSTHRSRAFREVA
jgi:hypothetical protein